MQEVSKVCSLIRRQGQAWGYRDSLDSRKTGVNLAARGQTKKKPRDKARGSMQRVLKGEFTGKMLPACSGLHRGGRRCSRLLPKIHRRLTPVSIFRRTARPPPFRYPLITAQLSLLD
jgi:hypothetical protein